MQEYRELIIDTLVITHNLPMNWLSIASYRDVTMFTMTSILEAVRSDISMKVFTKNLHG